MKGLDFKIDKAFVLDAQLLFELYYHERGEKYPVLHAYPESPEQYSRRLELEMYLASENLLKHVGGKYRISNKGIWVFEKGDLLDYVRRQKDFMLRLTAAFPE